MRTLECHEEKIHLLGHIQDLGFLLVFQERICVAVSENICIYGYRPHQLIKMPIDTIFNKLLPGHNVEDIENRIKNKSFYRFVERILFNNLDYFLSIYEFDSKIYIEAELADSAQIKTTSLYSYAKHIEDHGNHRTWQSLTEMIREITGFDRVMVYQFFQNDGGKVIAESKLEDTESFLGYRYPEFDIPKQARELYKLFHARQTADVDAPVHGLLGLPHE